MSIDYTHYHALAVRLSHEKARLDAATSDNEKRLRAVWVAQIEREIEAERQFLGLDEIPQSVECMSDDELLAALNS